MAELSIIIISHSHGSLLIQLLESLERQLPPFEFRVRLILNAPEEERILVNLSRVNLDISISQRNLSQSLSSNLNACIREVDTPYSLILNPDVILPNENLHQMFKFLKSSNSDLATCQAKSPENQDLVNLRHFPSLLSLLYERLTSEGSRLKTQHNIMKGMDTGLFWIQGSYLMAPTSTFQELSFDERYPLYFEDVDFCRRLVLTGKKIGICKETYFIHYFQRKSSQIFSKYFFLHLYSALLYFMKYRLSQPKLKPHE